MTPTAAHVSESSGSNVHSVNYPDYVQSDLVKLQADDRAVAKLLALRDKWKILNPEYFDGTYLHIPRELAQELV